MKIIQIISPGHSGSTIIDIILGSNSQLISSGELRKLPWQIQRGINKEVSVERQNICTCLTSFHDCQFWDNVIKNISERVKYNLKKYPEKFEISFFGEFGHYLHSKKPTLNQKIQGKIYRMLLQNSLLNKKLMRYNSSISSILDNNWILFEEMIKASKRDIIIDSSKDIKRALLLHNDRPDLVYLIFLNRDLKGHLSSLKRRYNDLNINKSSKEILQDIFDFRNRTKNTIKSRNIKYLEIEYEDIIKNTNEFYLKLSEFLNEDIKPDIKLIEENEVNTTKMHLVAGNPTRYRGIMKLKLDNRWEEELSEEDLEMVNLFEKKNLES